MKQFNVPGIILFQDKYSKRPSVYRNIIAAYQQSITETIQISYRKSDTATTICLTLDYLSTSLEK